MWYGRTVAHRETRRALCERDEPMVDELFGGMTGTSGRPTVTTRVDCTPEKFWRILITMEIDWKLE